jgi:hypothetical protein
MIFSAIDAGITGYSHANEWLDTDLTPFIKINSKWITKLNVELEIIQLLEDNAGENPDDLVFNDFLYTTPKVHIIE